MDNLFKRRLTVLLVIVLLAGFFRFWQLSSYPVSLTIDEVAVGYNAYSILKTSRDEHGQFLPLAFLSIGDYKPPLHIYLAVPTIAIFGLTELGVRFSMALFSTLTVIMLFLLVKEITRNQSIALIAAFLLAISPWHIHLGRFSHENSLGLFLVITAVWLFLRALEKKGQLLWLAAVCFVLSMYAYHAERIFTPLLVIGLGIIFWKKLIRFKVATIIALVIGTILLIPLLQIIFGTAGQARAKDVFINKDPAIQTQLLKKENNRNLNVSVNNFFVLTNQWSKKYLNYFDPGYLFFSGLDFTQPGRPDVGLFYLFELPFFLLGIWFVFIKKTYENKNLILFWLLVGPIVASLTIEEQHIFRNLVTLPPLLFLITIGVWEFWKVIKKQRFVFKAIAYSLGTVVLILSGGYYLTIYYINYPIQRSEYWQYGWKEAAIYAWENKDKYGEIVVDPKFGSEAPYLVGTPPGYFLFYGKYDPLLYQQSPRRKEKLSTDFENFTFRPIYWPNDRYRADTLFIGSPWVLPKEDITDSQIKKIIKFKNGVNAFLIVESTGSAKLPLY